MTAAWRRRAGLVLLLACVGAAASGLKPSLHVAPDTMEVVRPAAPEVSPARQSLGKVDFYDPNNPDLIHLQRHDEAVAGLPKDANGFPDWMRALRNGSIRPRTGLTPDAGMSVFDLDVIMKNTREMPWVRFPHAAHTLWLDCSNCHPQPFEPRAGATPITMADIFRGKYCGMCHDRVAFVTFFSCQRCHSEPQSAPPAARR